jgi:hypothetical protein
LTLLFDDQMIGPKKPANDRRDRANDRLMPSGIKGGQ